MKPILVILPILCSLVLAGCGAPEPVRFRLNMEGRDRSEITRDQQQMLVDGLTAAFGTPDDPFVFPETGLDINKLRLAAGPSMSTQDGTRQGLYRQHCAHCHGISGDGYGPTAAFLNPYPRDYRKGIFKFTSTEDGAKATREDLRRTIVQGIAGTAMPSFALLPADEIDALVEYVKYLSLRGETEELLFDRIVNQGETAPLTREIVVDEAMMPPVNMWNEAENKVKHPPARPENLGPLDHPTKESLDKGRALFADAVKGQCIKCHGPSGLGDGGEIRYDVWNKPKSDLVKAGRSIEDVNQLYLLPIQELKARNLRMGVYRGGRRPVDLYRRIYAGIKGAEMPALGATEVKPGLSNEEIWSLVDYVRSLPYEEPSRQPQEHAHTAQLRTN